MRLLIVSLLVAGAVAAPSSAQEPKKALVGTWSAFSGGVNSSEFPSRLMAFRSDGTVCLEAVGDGRYEFEGNQVRVRVKASGLPYDVDMAYVVDVLQADLIALRHPVDDKPGGGEIGYVLRRNTTASKSCP